ncbi:MAG: MotA/TolQ/ExbB proton channel family protein, partial [Parachlamydiales bacterium]
FGKAIFLLLFLLSLSSWIVMLYKMRLTAKAKKEAFQFEKAFESQKENMLKLKTEHYAVYFNPYVHIFEMVKGKTLDLLKKNSFFTENKEGVYLSTADMGLIESQVESTISHQTKILEKNLFILSTVITLAPFLGLLGTVWGILITFTGLQAHLFASSNSAVLSGLSMALATTVIGLVVAIPALVAYNYLKNSVREFTKDMHHFSHKVLALLEIQYRKVEKE